MKKIIFLILAFNFFAVSKAQPTIATKPMVKDTFTKLIYGVRVGGFVLDHLNYVPGAHVVSRGPLFGTDYTAFIQYKGVGVFGGITSLYNIGGYNTYTNDYPYATTTLSSKPNCFNVGLLFKLNPRGKRNCFYLYIYDIHYSYLNPVFQFNYSHGFGSNHNYLFYKEVNDFITINPRYRFTTKNKFVSAEIGLSFAAVKTKIFSNGGDEDSDSFPLGANLSLAFNVSALFAKK